MKNDKLTVWELVKAIPFLFYVGLYCIYYIIKKELI